LDPKDLEKLQKFREKQEGRGEMLPKPKKKEFGSLLGVMSSLYLQNRSLSCKNSKQSLLEMLQKHQEKLQKFSVYTQKISSKVL
jgi:hypothetical protein